MFNIKKIKIFLLIFFVFASYQANAQQTINKILDEYISNYIKIKQIPSVTAGLLVNKEIKWFNSIGYSDIENNVAVSEKSLFRIASITKPMTAVAIMQLWEKGIINLDIDIRKYISYFPEKKYKFTIRQLLSQTSRNHIQKLLKPLL